MSAFLIGPNAPERNPPIVPQYYAPSVFYITAITLGLTTTVTTATDHNYSIGGEVRMHIPTTYGTIQLNGAQAVVISIPSSTQVELLIDSQQFDSFISSPTYGPTKPQICGIGDLNSGSINSFGRVGNILNIAGSFVNTSPIEGTWLS